MPALTIETRMDAHTEQRRSSAGVPVRSLERSCTSAANESRGGALTKWLSKSAAASAEVSAAYQLGRPKSRSAATQRL